MKLFKRLLVAPAALGLLAPLTANAAELNLNDVENYSNGAVETINNFSEIYPTDWAFKALTDVASSRGFTGVIPSGSISRFEAASIINASLQNVAELTEQEQRLINEFSTEIAVLKSRVDGLETRINDFEAGGFSDTTTASFSADFAVGAVDGVAAEDAVQAIYGFQIDLTTSFTGDDSLDISIDAGTGGSGLTELDLNDGGSDDVLYVDGVSYTFPLGDKLTVAIGDNMDGSALYSTACVYGTISNTLDDCGNASSALNTSIGTSLSASYDVGNGFTAAFGYEGDGSSSNGLLTKEGLDAFGGQLTYTGDQYGASVTYASIETSTTAETVYWGLNGYWTPEDADTAIPSISVGYEVGNPSASSNDTTHWFVGLQWDEVGPGTLGAALGTQQHYADNATEYLMYEAFYSYDVNDGMTVTPLVYVKETASGSDDETGVMVKTSFSF